MRRCPSSIARSCGVAALAPTGGRPEGAHAGKSWTWVPVLAAALLLGLGACSQADDRDGPAGGSTPGPTGHVVEGTPTQGAHDVASPRYRVRGSLGHGSSPTLQSTSYRIEQGTLR